mgnify:CR=1 FL=1
MSDIIPAYSKQDYIMSTAPFEWLHQFKENPLRLEQMTNIISEKAMEVGVKNFRTLYKKYTSLLNRHDDGFVNRTTNFEAQDVELDCGEWQADESGVTTINPFGIEIVACNHPILPVQRLVNIDTGIEKLKIAFRKGKSWRYIIADKKVLASATSILQLADYGIAVNSENSKHLVKYLTDIEHLNYDRIEELNSVCRLGWIDNYGFSPYVENLVFDGDIAFKNFFESVQEKGDYKKWLDLCKEIRKGNVYARIMLAASFSSVLIAPCDCLPFFVHLWGGSETGKTVGLMLAASVWANPEMGRYIHSFNSTAVAQEYSAGFVNSMPLILDELQIIKEKKDFDNLIYQLAEGVGRSRGQKTGGLQKTMTWKNCFLTTGEFPLSSSGSGSGAVNRIIEIDCKDIKLFADPVKVVDVVKKNHGFAGKIFCNLLQDETIMQYAKNVQKQIYKEISNGETTEKQAAAASLILTADRLINEWIFNDNQTLKVSDIEPFLSTKSEVSQNERALDFIYDYVSINQNHFFSNSFGEYTGEIWGETDETSIYIIKSQFDKIMSDNGFNSTAFISWARTRGIIKIQGGKSTITKRIKGQVCRCVQIKKPIEEIKIDDKSLPFEA